MGRERLNDLIDVDTRGDFLEPAERCAHDRDLDVGHLLDRADPELLGDFHAARAREASELGAVCLQKVVHFVRVQVDRVAHVESGHVAQLLVHLQG